MSFLAERKRRNVYTLARLCGDRMAIDSGGAGGVDSSPDLRSAGPGDENSRHGGRAWLSRRSDFGLDV